MLANHTLPLLAIIPTRPFAAPRLIRLLPIPALYRLLLLVLTASALSFAVHMASAQFLCSQQGKYLYFFTREMHI